MFPDFSPAWKTLHAMGRDATERLPYFLVALVVLGLFYLAAKRVRSVLRRGSLRVGRSTNFSALVSRVGGDAVLAGGVLVAVTIAVPSLSPATLLSAFGFVGVAVGFALRDILGNLLCGLVILASEPFRIGDRIAVKGFEGEVEDVQTRATTIRTRDGKRVVVPNSIVFGEPVEVVTAFGNRRLETSVPVGAANWENAKSRAIEAMRGVEGVEAEPPPTAFLLELKENSATLGLHWWVSNQSEKGEPHSRDAVLGAVSSAIHNK